MKYWFLIEATETPGICGSMTALEEATGINYDTLTYHFTRMKRKRYRKKGIWIEYLQIKTTKRK